MDVSKLRLGTCKVLKHLHTIFTYLVLLEFIRF